MPIIRMPTDKELDKLMSEDDIQFCEAKVEFVHETPKAKLFRKLTEPTRLAWFPLTAIAEWSPESGELGWHSWFSPEWKVEK